MRIVVVGATGNVGTAVLRRLAVEPAVDEIVGVARRTPPEGAGAPYDRTRWAGVDIGTAGAVEALTTAFTGADAVIHLAWQIQPSHDRGPIRRTNVTGASNVAEATVRAGVPALVVASSVGAYARGPKDRLVNEDWPATGIRESSYSRDKAAVERLLDEVQRVHPQLRIVRLRPGLTFQRQAGSQIARYFLGPLAPVGLLRYRRLPVVPSGSRLRAQAVHADDVADAYLSAVRSDVRGAFNIAADPVLDAASVADRFGGLQVPVPAELLRAVAALTWHARLQPTEPGWLSLAVGCPLMSSERARSELGWQPRFSALDALDELLRGLGDRAGTGAAAMRPGSATRELAAVAGGHLPGHGDPY